jgi:TM2 domain-containing membrane protein YozV
VSELMCMITIIVIVVIIMMLGGIAKKLFANNNACDDTGRAWLSFDGATSVAEVNICVVCC